MNILVIKNAEWNDVTFANNLLTNWFEEVDANFANVYCGPGLPLNNICEKYFQITDGQLLKSLFLIGRAGKPISILKHKEYEEKAKKNANRIGVYGFFKKISLIMRTPVMLIRDFLWLRGRYDKTALRKFIDEFSPDIILSYRVFNPQMCMIERLVFEYANAPMVAYTGDDEVMNDCYPRISFSQWRKNYTRRLFSEQSSMYSHYFTHSADLSNQYTNKYGIPSSVIYKGAMFQEKFLEKDVHKPIKLVYAGRICYGRWKTIVEIGKNIDRINQEGDKMQLYVYSQDILSAKEKADVEKIRGLNFCGVVNSSELVKVYEHSDIALHIESFEKKYSLATMYSFSTKIVDLMNSTCAIMAVCEENQAGLKYLKDNDAAFVITNYDDIYAVLLGINENPASISRFARKAWELGKKNHDKQENRKTLMRILNRIAQNGVKKQL